MSRELHVFNNALSREVPVCRAIGSVFETLGSLTTFEADTLGNFYQHALDQAAIVAVTDVKGTILSVNDHFCRLSGYTKDELIGANHRLIRSGVHDREFFRDMYRQISQGQIWRGEICNRAKKGNFYWVDTTIVPHLENGRVKSYTAIRFDITPLKQAQARLTRVAQTDALTGLPNRAAFLEALDERVSGCRSLPIIVGIIDVDHFKDLNDFWGHRAGDLLLSQLAKRLSRTLGPYACIGRVGGDEFAFFMADTGGSLALCIEAIAAAVSTPFNLQEGSKNIGLSAGLCRFPDQGSDADTVLRHADLALYEVKAAGGNATQVFDESLADAHQERLVLRNSIENALSKEELEVYYQPIISVAEIGPMSCEALIRWNHPEKGLLMPGTFFDAFQDDRLAHLLGMYVLERVINQIVCWRHAGFPFDKISVNASLADFRSNGFTDLLIAAIDSGLICASDISVEIVEGMLLDRPNKRVRCEIDKLHKRGIQISFDDFGTGYASLSHLRDLPIDQVKIDKSFIDSLADDQNDRAIVSTLISLAHRLNMKVTAEGVETSAQVDILKQMGCDRVQGFLFGKAMRVDELEELNYPMFV